MIRSMTGFGRGEYVDDVRKVTVEIKTVNHRYLDIYVKMSRKYSFAEDKIKARIKEGLGRGKAEVSVMVDNFGISDADVRLDKDLAGKYTKALSELGSEFCSEEASGMEDQARDYDPACRRQQGIRVCPQDGHRDCGCRDQEGRCGHEV